MESVIEVRGLALAFGEGPTATSVFSDIDLTVAAGEFLVIVGASGVGKSTLLRVLAGLIPATSGRVLLHTPAEIARPCRAEEGRGKHPRRLGPDRRRWDLR